MKYFLQRDGKTYGPYSFDDLKRYQAENRIGPNDVVRREDSDQWQPWQQVLNPPAAQPPAQAPAAFPPMPAAPQPAPQAPQQPQAPTFSPAPSPSGWDTHPQPRPDPWASPGQQQPGFGGQPSSFGAPQQPSGSQPSGFGSQPAGGPPFGGGFGAQQPQYASGFGGGATGPMPPDMQWYIVLLITLLCGFFGIYWLFKQASFVQKIDPQSKGKKMLILGFLAILAGYLVMLLGTLLAAMTENGLLALFGLLAPFVFLGAAVCMIIGVFDMRKSIHNYYTTVEPMGINLMTTEGALLTFFFAMYYFQYHFANIAARKKALGHQ